MKIAKKIAKWILYILAIPIVYFIIAYLLTSIPVNTTDITENTAMIYLSNNGVHVDIILQKKDIDADLLKDLTYLEEENYLSFGWGDENFYLHTPTWNDLTFGNAFKALLLKSTALLHVNRYKQKNKSWIEVPLNTVELAKINQYISTSFTRDSTGNKMILPGLGYGQYDNFYTANGSYSCLNTCNTWANTVFKKSGLKACLWTPFEFGLIDKYEKD